jgi:hypothetical protein
MADPTIGLLRHRVEIFARVSTPVGEIEIGTVETLVGKVYASVEPVGAVTYFSSLAATAAGGGAGVLDAPITHRIFMRYRPGLTSDQHIIKHPSREALAVFRVRRVLHLNGRERWTVLEVQQEHS